PAIDEGASRAVCLTQIDVAAARLRKARRELRITERTGRTQRSHDRPHCERRPRTAERPHHRRRREKDAYADYLAHDHRRGCPGAEEDARGRGMSDRRLRRSTGRENQLASGISALSMTRTSTGPRWESSFSPRSSRKAVNSDGLSDGGRLTPGGRVTPT